MAGNAAGIIGNLRILVDADTSRAQMALRKMGGHAGVAGAAIGAALGMAGVAALRIGADYEKATRAIRIGTGLVGDDLQAVEDSFKRVAAKVPDDLATVAQAMADVQSRTGATGERLEALTESFVDMSRMLNVETGTAIANITRMYGDWSVATTDQVAANDLLLRASQATGTSVDKLSEQMVQFGAPLRNIGIEFEGAIAMLAKWEKEGVNTTLALGGMKIALGEFAKEGIDAKEGLDDLIKRIIETDNVAQAMAWGVERFGSRAGPDMVAAIREGRFEFEDFQDSLTSGTETVQGLADRTRTMGDAIRETMNRVKVAVGPLTDSLSGISDAMGNAIFLLPAMAGALGNAIGRMWTSAMATGAGQKVAAVAGAAAGKVYAAAAAVGQKLLAGVIALWNMMGGKKVLAVAGAAGAKAGAAYGAVAAGAMKAGMVAKGIWAAASSAIGGLMGTTIAAVALPIISLALVALAGKMAVDLAGNVGKWQGEAQARVDEAVHQTASEAIQNLEVLTDLMHESQGIGRIFGDTFGGKQQAEGLLNLARAIRDDSAMTAAEIAKAGELLASAAHEAASRGNEAVANEIEAIAQVVSQRVPVVKEAVASYADAFTRMDFRPPSVAGKVRAEFKLATAEVAKGFGNVKQALANPPQMISKKDRLSNMAGRMKKVMANIKKATEVGDPMAQRYWEKARARQQQQIDKLKGKTVAKLSEVKTAYKKAGVSVKGTWTNVRDKTKSAATAAADGAIEQVGRVPTAIEGMNLTTAGTNLMGTWATGIRAGISSAVAAANEAAAAVAAVTVGSSPPPKGPLRNIDKGGRNVMDAWLSGFDHRRAGKVGAQLAKAVTPHPSFGSMALATAGAGMGGGTTVVNVGTLIANDAGLDELDRRMSRRRSRTSRARRLYNDVN